MGNSRNSVNSIDQLKTMVNIVDFIGKYVKLTQKGNKWVGCCPFHKEKTPSFAVSDFYYCFGCHATGDVIRFVQDYHNISFVDSVKKIGEDCGISVNIHSENTEKKEENQKKYDIMLHAKDYYHSKLIKNKDAFPWQYVSKKRKLTQETIESFEIGYSPAIKNQLYKHLSALNYTHNDILASGLVREFGTSYYDFFDGRIIVPIKDNQGRTIGFGGRIFNGEESAKYINSAESDLFKKRETLFNFAKAKQAKMKNKTTPIIMVEGYMDVIMMSQFDFNGGIAPLGTGITEQQIKMAFGVDKSLYFCFNSDTAGKNASLKVAQMVAKMIINTDLTPKFVNLEPFKDADELLNGGKNGAIIFAERLNAAKILNEFLWSALSEEIDTKDANKRANLENTLIKFAETIPNSLVKKSYINFFKQKIFEIGRNKKASISVKKINIDKTIPNQINDTEAGIIALFIACPALQHNETIGIENIIDYFASDCKACYQFIIENRFDDIWKMNQDFVGKINKQIGLIKYSLEYIKKDKIDIYFVLLLERKIFEYNLIQLKSRYIDFEKLSIEHSNIMDRIKEIDSLIDEYSIYT